MWQCVYEKRIGLRAEERGLQTFWEEIEPYFVLVDFERPEQISKDEPRRFNISHVANKPRLLVNIFNESEENARHNTVLQIGCQ